MNIDYMTYEDFMKIPLLDWQKEIDCDGLILIPHSINKWSLLKYRFRKFLSTYWKIFSEPQMGEIGGMHESGYRCMSFIAIINDKPAYRLSGCSDVVHFDGIGGYGLNWLERYGTVPRVIPPSGWTMDCLAGNGFLRIWCDHKIHVGHSLSSFSIYKSDQEINWDELAEDQEKE